MDDDQANTSPLGVRRLPRRAIMARAVPHFACSEQRQVKRWTRQAARHANPVRACKGHAGTSERGASPLTSGESARFPLEPRAKREASAASLAPSIKGVGSAPWEGETRTSEDTRIELSLSLFFFHPL